MIGDRPSMTGFKSSDDRTDMFMLWKKNNFFINVFCLYAMVSS